MSARGFLFLFILFFLSLAVAQPASWVQLPQSAYQLAGDAVLIKGSGFSDTYVFGFGWLGGSNFDAPQLTGSVVSVSPELFAALGSSFSGAALVEPRAAFAHPAGGPYAISGVRFGGSGQVRVVLDVPDAPAAALKPLTQAGRSSTRAATILRLPGLLPPVDRSSEQGGVSVRFSEQAGVTQLELSAAPFAYDLFVVADPTRIVLDVIPLDGPFSAAQAPAAPTPAFAAQVNQIRPGVNYHRYRAPNGVAESNVHLLEIAPGAGEFRVVGASEASGTLSELAAGAIAAINAGYFNTTTFEAIGLLRVDHGVQTMPTLNRASIGFGPDGTEIARVQARLRVRSGGRLLLEEPLENGTLELHVRPGARAGTSAQGVLTVSGGRVLVNRIGPLLVPADGFALVYAPGQRELALLDPGVQLSYDSIFEPAVFDSMRYAVEAGPLLIERGESAFNPDLERFQRGQRILDEYTSQAAIGVRRDGTVLMVVADNMRAEDLVPLFLAQGAWQAMRLDSGGSATLYADGKVLNRSTQRRIVTAIVLVAAR